MKKNFRSRAMDEAFRLEQEVLRLRDAAAELHSKISWSLEPLELPNLLNAVGVKDLLGSHEVTGIEADPAAITQTKAGIRASVTIHVLLTKKETPDGQ